MIWLTLDFNATQLLEHCLGQIPLSTGSLLQLPVVVKVTSMVDEDFAAASLEESGFPSRTFPSKLSCASIAAQSGQ
jgi:hypothetical protein